MTSLGLGLVLTGGLLAGCEAPDVNEPPVAQVSASEVPALTPVADGGEGGEGEGGVAIADASTSPIVYNSALAITAAHIFAARDAHAAGEFEAAAEMFSHPVSEVLLDMEPVFAERGVEPFSQLLLDASAAVFDGETSAQIAERSEAILAAIAAASEFAPDDGSTSAAIAAGVAVDQIDRASDMYRIAKNTGQYGPYLDGYGFLKAGELAFADHAETIEAENPNAASQIRAALSLLAQAYPSAELPDSLDLDPAALNSASSAAMVAVLYE